MDIPHVLVDFGRPVLARFDLLVAVFTNPILAVLLLSMDGSHMVVQTVEVEEIL